MSQEGKEVDGWQDWRLARRGRGYIKRTSLLRNANKPPHVDSPMQEEKIFWTSASPLVLGKSQITRSDDGARIKTRHSGSTPLAGGTGGRHLPEMIGITHLAQSTALLRGATGEPQARQVAG